MYTKAVYQFIPTQDFSVSNTAYRMMIAKIYLVCKQVYENKLHILKTLLKNSIILNFLSLPNGPVIRHPSCH